MTKEHKRKIGSSNAKIMKQKWQNPEYRKKMKKAQKNHKVSDEFRKKCKERMKSNKYNLGRCAEKAGNWKGGFPLCKFCGEKITRNSKTKICSKCYCGENHPFWKGGISSEYSLIRKSPEHKNWRLSVFERDKFLCQMPDCDKIKRDINSHHIKPFLAFPELRFDTKNGITLCEKCHRRTYKNERKFENLFIEIIKLKR